MSRPRKDNGRPTPKVVGSDESIVIPFMAPKSLPCRIWEREHCRSADRRGLRYPSDLSDSEWAVIEPMIPPAKTWRPTPRDRCPGSLECGLLRALERLPMASVAEGLPPKRRRVPTSCSGSRMAPWSAYITSSISRGASTKSGKRARRPPSSTARAPRSPKRGAALDPQGLDAARRLRAASGIFSSTRSACS
jgi:hypothetical protein